MSALEFILLTQLSGLLSNLNSGLGLLINGLVTEFIHALNVLITFVDGVLPPYAA